MTLVLPSHGSLSDSDRESPRLSPKSGHSMMRQQPADPASGPLTAAARREARQPPQGERLRHASMRRPSDRTSRPVAPATDPLRRHRNCSGKRPPSSSQLLRGYEQADQTTDATDTELPVLRSRGRSVVALYNTVRPHSSLGYKPPAPEAVLWPASQPGPASPATPTVAQRPIMD